jgi:signal transduction histidine kinase
VLAEQVLFRNLQGLAVIDEAPIAPEILVPRMGDIMVEKGLLSQAQLQKALEYQRHCAQDGQIILLGQAMLELGLVKRQILDTVITQQIFDLQAALREANLQLENRVQERTRDLQAALARVSELNQLKADFISNISHELRTPLTHLKGYLDMWGEGILGPVSRDQREALEIMHNAEARLERLIDDLIEFSLASRSQVKLNFSEVDLWEIVQNISNRYAPTARTKAINLEVEMRADLPHVLADGEKIKWVLAQLTDNALKFTSDHGWVKIQAGLVDESSHNEQVFVAVTDTGIGIPNERLEELFQPFHQLDGSISRRYSGTGLGLAMVKYILDAHKSQIMVESMVGNGTCFHFSLPVWAEGK